MSNEDVSIDEIMGLLEEGLSGKQVAAVTGCSIATIQSRVATLMREQGVLESYRNVQHLELTKIQARILDAITDDMLANASLKELSSAYKVFKEKEQTDLGKPTEIKGLVAYLVHLEQEDLKAKAPVAEATVIETTATEVAPTPHTNKTSFVDGVPQF